MKYLNCAAKVVTAALVAAFSFGAHAQASPKAASPKSTAFEVELKWSPLQNSAEDSLINEATVKQKIADELARLNIRPTFVKKSNAAVFLRIRLNYLHIDQSNTRVLTGVAGTMIQGSETCSVDLMGWDQNASDSIANIKAVLTGWMPAFNKNCNIV